MHIRKEPPAWNEQLRELGFHLINCLLSISFRKSSRKKKKNGGNQRVLASESKLLGSPGGSYLAKVARARAFFGQA